jgi:predicted lipoprotein with Yx(FWY)xxD motif
MNTRTTRSSKAALLLGGVALAAAACGSGNAANNNSSAGGGSGAVVTTASVNGTSVLATSDGHTLYDTKSESAGDIYCIDACTHFWKPLMASETQAKQASSALAETFGVVIRPDGGSQLALGGHPLYTFTQEGAHQLRGNGFSDEFQGTHFEWTAVGTRGSSGSQPSMGSSQGIGSGGHYGY